MNDKLIYLGGGTMIVVAIAAAFWLRPLTDDTTMPPAPEAVAAITAEAQDEAQDEAREETPAEVVSVVPSSTDETSASEVTPDLVAPVMTNLRIEPDGMMVIFGRASPGVTVAITVDGVAVDTVTADEMGVFQAYPMLGYSDRPRLMQLIADPNGRAMAAAESYPIAANPAPIATPDIVASAQTQSPEDLSETSPVVTEAEGDVVDTPAMAETDASEIDSEPPVETASEDSAQSPTAETAAVSAPSVLAVDEEGVRVLQPATPDHAPEVMSSVALDTITYDPQGEVILSGRAAGQGFVNVYVDNEPISSLPIDPAGNWRTDLPQVDTGVYTLRIDEVDAAGDVVSRIETPFKRENPEDVAAVMADETADPNFVVATRTVQPGNTLWAIAQDRYGEGVMYVRVFEANADRIRDPDLIYPGQVFVLPDTGE